MTVILLLTGLVMAIGAGAVASSKNRSFLGYFLLGLIFPLIGLLIAIGMAPRPVGPANAGPRVSLTGWFFLAAIALGGLALMARSP